MIDYKNISLESLNKYSTNTMVGVLGIEFTEVGADFVSGRMPVDHRTHQPYGLLHGGASIALAETLGSTGASLHIDSSQYYVVGLDINGNHIRGVRSGWVYGKATALHIGKTTHVWQIEIKDEEGNLVNISRLTMAVVPIKK